MEVFSFLSFSLGFRFVVSDLFDSFENGRQVNYFVVAMMDEMTNVNPSFDLYFPLFYGHNSRI